MEDEERSKYSSIPRISPKYYTSVKHPSANLSTEPRREPAHDDFVMHGEFKWRAGAATFWAITLMPFIAMLFEFLTYAHPLQPFTWIKGSLSHMMSLRFVLGVFFIQILCIPVTIFYFKCMRVYPVLHRSHWHQLAFILHPRQLSWIVANGFFGLLYSAIFCALKKQHNIKSSDFDESMKPFLVFGLVLGFRYGFCFYTQQKYLLKFPIIQEQRFVRFRASIFFCVKSAFIECFQTMKVSFVIFAVHWMFIHSMDYLLATNSQTTSSVPNHSSISILSFLWICLIMGLSIHLALSLTESLFKIFTTQAYSFVLNPDFVGDDRILLQDALLSNYDLLKHLAFLDFSYLAKFDSKRRKQIFSITQPGGHAEKWNLIMSQCLSLLAYSKQRFDDVNLSELQRGKPKPDTTLFSPEHRKQQDNILTRQRQMSRTLFSPQKSLTSTEDLIASKAQLSFSSSTSDKIPKTPSKLKATVTGMFTESQLLNHQELFQDHQLIFWVLEGLSSMVAASFDEDSFGVVQRTLPDVLLSLLSYLETLERYILTTVTDERAQIRKLKEFHKNRETTIKAQSYKIALQSAIYKITTKFGHHLQSIRLPLESKKRLNSFIDFKN